MERKTYESAFYIMTAEMIRTSKDAMQSADWKLNEHLRQFFLRTDKPILESTKSNDLHLLFEFIEYKSTPNQQGSRKNDLQICVAWTSVRLSELKFGSPQKL